MRKQRITRLLGGRKPQSINFPATARKRQFYRSRKGKEFPRKKRRIPNIARMFAALKPLAEKKNNPAIVDYFLSSIFPHRTKGLLEYAGFERHKTDKIRTSKDFENYRCLLEKRVRECSNAEAKRIELAVDKIYFDLRKTANLVKTKIFAKQIFHGFYVESPEDVALVQESFTSVYSVIDDHIKFIRSELEARQRKQ